MPELVSCPLCGCKVQVPELLLGRRTRCIACGQTFVAGEQPPPGQPAGYPLRPEEEDAPPPRPPLSAAGLPRHRLPLCPRCHRPAGWEELACPHCGHLFEPEVPTGAPAWARRRDGEPHRGRLIDTLGSVSLLCGTLGMCVPVLGPLVALGTGIPALVMAGNDLERMRQGLRDPEGRRDTELGRNKAIVGVVVAVLAAVFTVLFYVHVSRL
jgi:hypothetical protein